MNSAAAMNLQQLFADLEYADIGNLAASNVVGCDIAVGGLSADSRKILPGDLYIALQGETVHGLDFLAQITESAAAVAVDADDQAALELQTELPVVRVTRLAQRMGEIASKFHGHPSRQFPICGITGTDGKTSVCRFVTDVLQTLGVKAGYIGTLGWGVGSELAPNPLTTPDAVTLQSMVADLYAKGAKFVALEVSSHALVQGRVNGVEFDVAALTNLGRDHLDYHGDIKNYRAAKQKLFQWPSLDTLVLNQDDEFGRALASADQSDYASGVTRIRYTTEGRTGCEIWAENIATSASGLQFDLCSGQQRFNIRTSLIGAFNVQNLLAAVAILGAFDFKLADIVAPLESLQPVAGRMECFRQKACATTVVDFAHTPQALESALTAIKKHCEGELWVVFGCGGDRDIGKRPQMGEIAARCADHVIVTDDNPRSEPSEKILADIVAGIGGINSAPSMSAIVIANRELAISHALSNAKAHDWILVAGKGHEDYQIVGAETLAFSDREVVASLQSALSL